MPDNREYQNNADSICSNVSAENQSLDEGIRRLKLEDSIEEVDACSNPYPCRPGEPDCIYFLRTGSCGYGRNCRYNHPNYAAQGTREKGELPERGGQPDCQHFLKTGLCKYGTTCKYNHPREKHREQAVSLNVLGFPMRQDEKSCPFYMRTGTCKYGVACKFNHPQPATMGTVYPISDASAYGSAGTPVVAMSNGPAVGGSAWPLSTGLPYISTSDMQNLQAYMPIILSPHLGNMPLQQGWTTYTGSMSLVPSAGVLETTYPPKSKNNSFPSASRIENLPQSLDQPECQHFMRTGRCKYGSACKYNHPIERNPAATAILGPLGLPLRPGHPMCSFYRMYGTCKYGSACRYDHPVMSYYNYTMPGVSIPNSMGFFPHHSYPQIPWNLMERTSDNIVEPETKDKIVPSDGNEFGNRSAESSSPSFTGVSSDSLPSHSD